MVLLSARGKTVPEIADLTLFDADTVLYWLDRYEADGLADLATKPRSGRPPKSRPML
jgi:transposase